MEARSRRAPTRLAAIYLRRALRATRRLDPAIARRVRRALNAPRRRKTPPADQVATPPPTPRRPPVRHVVTLPYRGGCHALSGHFHIHQTPAGPFRLVFGNLTGSTILATTGTVEPLLRAANEAALATSLDAVRKALCRIP